MNLTNRSFNSIYFANLRRKNRLFTNHTLFKITFISFHLIFTKEKAVILVLSIPFREIFINSPASSIWPFFCIRFLKSPLRTARSHKSIRKWLKPNLVTSRRLQHKLPHLLHFLGILKQKKSSRLDRSVVVYFLSSQADCIDCVYSVTIAKALKLQLFDEAGSREWRIVQVFLSFLDGLFCPVNFNYIDLNDATLFTMQKFLTLRQNKKPRIRGAYLPSCYSQICL